MGKVAGKWHLSGDCSQLFTNSLDPGSLSDAMTETRGGHSCLELNYTVNISDKTNLYWDYFWPDPLNKYIGGGWGSDGRTSYCKIEHQLPRTRSSEAAAPST